MFHLKLFIIRLSRVKKSLIKNKILSIFVVRGQKLIFSIDNLILSIATIIVNVGIGHIVFFIRVSFIQITVFGKNIKNNDYDILKNND